MTRPSAAAFLLAATLAACGLGGAGRVTLTGQAVAGPVCPVETVSPDPSCADRPVADAVLVFRDADGREVARATSDPEGRFSVDLTPGSYVIVPLAVEGLMGTASPVSVKVAAGSSPPRVIVAYDTGIR